MPSRSRSPGTFRVATVGVLGMLIGIAAGAALRVRVDDACFAGTCDLGAGNPLMF